MSQGGQSLGCFGLSREEVDYITDDISKTLGHEQGRQIFRSFLQEGQRTTDLACLDLYEQCQGSIEKDRAYRLSVQEADLEELTGDVYRALFYAEGLSGVAEIDVMHLERCAQALDENTREAMLNALEDTKTRLMHHLRDAHSGFRAYVINPCPRS